MGNLVFLFVFWVVLLVVVGLNGRLHDPHWRADLAGSRFGRLVRGYSVRVLHVLDGEQRVPYGWGLLPMGVGVALWAFSYAPRATEAVPFPPEPRWRVVVMLAGIAMAFVGLFLLGAPRVRKLILRRHPGVRRGYVVEKEGVKTTTWDDGTRGVDVQLPPLSGAPGTYRRVAVTEGDERGEVTQWEETRRGQDTTVRPATLETSVSFGPAPGSELRTALTSELAVAMELRDHLPSPQGTHLLFPEWVPTTEADVIALENRVSALLVNYPQMAIRFKAPVPPMGAIPMATSNPDYLGHRLNHRVDVLEQLIKGLR